MERFGFWRLFEFELASTFTDVFWEGVPGMEKALSAQVQKWCSDSNDRL